MEDAPFRSDLADAPEGGRIVWRKTDDGVRLRLGAWTAAGGKGTVLLFPGRTEYIEKYGRIIRDLTNAGWSVASLDWRGQGLSDRLDSDVRLGHVSNFLDYQRDVSAFVDWVEEIGLPRPRVLLAHSMGGCIGLRSLLNGLDVERAVFSAPMWGIQMPAYARPFAYVVPTLARLVKKGNLLAPGTAPTNYVSDTGFDTNMLTTDRETYDWLGQHAAAAPEFALGGPSVQWVGSATLEIDRLFSAKRPSIPCLTFVGSDERIVSLDAITKFHANWSTAELRTISGARHELMMEAPGIRERFMGETLEFFDAA